MELLCAATGTPVCMDKRYGVREELSRSRPQISIARTTSMCDHGAGKYRLGSRPPCRRHCLSTASMQLLGGLDLTTGEVAFGSRPDPKGHTARVIAEFQVIHIQTEQAGPVCLESGLM